ncbi:MAG: ROK family protein [Actinomycetaceae bacterium]|nr:ROK family protein [Actinomycetaceae bacterium]
MTTHACGIDVGGSGVKGGLVDLETGQVIGEIAKVATPHPATREAVTEACAQVAEMLNLPEGTPVGISFPAPIVHGEIPFMANLDQGWVGANIKQIMSERLNRPVTVLNDGDAACVGEWAFGAAKGIPGTVIVTTLGTGIGAGMVVNGRLVPNLELGHLEVDGHDAETRASARVKTEENLSWEEFAARLQRYYSTLEKLTWPDLIVVGGGVSENADKFLPLLDLRTRIVPATLENTAGIVGAAWVAREATQE